MKSYRWVGARPVRERLEPARRRGHGHALRWSDPAGLSRGRGLGRGWWRRGSVAPHHQGQIEALGKHVRRSTNTVLQARQRCGQQGRQGLAPRCHSLLANGSGSARTGLGEWVIADDDLEAIPYDTCRCEVCAPHSFASAHLTEFEAECAVQQLAGGQGVVPGQPPLHGLLAGRPAVRCAAREGGGAD